MGVVYIVLCVLMFKIIEDDGKQLLTLIITDLKIQEVFTRVDGMSAVSKQPSCQDERLKALQVLSRITVFK